MEETEYECLENNLIVESGNIDNKRRELKQLQTERFAIRIPLKEMDELLPKEISTPLHHIGHKLNRCIICAFI